MLTFSLQLLDFLFNGRIYLYLILFLGIIILWACRLYLSRGYQPWASQFEGTAGVIIPVVDETPQVFRDVLQRILLQDPDELIVVINGNHNRGLEDLCNELGVRYLWCSVASKRKAISEGVKELRSEIIVLVDSDTLWERNALSELLKPFTESVIGGVTAKQRIFEPNRSFLTRWANWLERVRFSYSLPAMSELGVLGHDVGNTRLIGGSPPHAV